MKKFIISTFIAIIASASNAQTPEWNIVGIKDNTGKSVGYILHTYAVGIQTSSISSEKTVAGLRFICSTKSQSDPIVAIYWDKIKDSTLTSIRIKTTIDEKDFQETEWTQDNKLIYRTIKDSQNLINAMKNSSKVQFDWTSDQYKKTTIFSTKDLNKNLSDFNKICQ